ncbi:hypothetical protein MGP2080_13623 [marine gamma proteobacterium HTCC2080]|nr:hypothetical protein MGP2080_13623 [marine gamma proteobacterium HTCC2080]
MPAFLESSVITFIMANVLYIVVFLAVMFCYFLIMPTHSKSRQRSFFILGNACGC